MVHGDVGLAVALEPGKHPVVGLAVRVDGGDDERPRSLWLEVSKQGLERHDENDIDDQHARNDLDGS